MVAYLFVQIVATAAQLARVWLVPMDYVNVAIWLVDSIGQFLSL